MRILFADTLPAGHLERLRAAGHECVAEPELDARALPARVPGFDVLVVRSTRVSRETIAAGEQLRVIVRAGAGTNTIDVETAAQCGVKVCNVPGRNAVAVAELTLGLLIAIDRNIPACVADLRAGRWDKKRYSSAQGLYGRTLGIVGLGAIGLAVAERACGFGMRLLSVRRAGRGEAVEARIRALGIETVDSLETLAERADAITFHVPGNGATKGLLGRDLLARLRPGAIVINTSRGDLVDDAALLEAMDAKGIRAGLDVFAGEPGAGRAAFDSPLARHPNVVGTHHIGASTEQAQTAVADGVVEILEAFGEGTVLNCVNL